MVDVIKEYLVSLGFGVNTQSLNQARQAMRDAEGFISRFAGSSATQFAVAGTAVATFVVAANGALASFMNRIAQAQLTNEMFARQMYTTVENASAITGSLKAMGRSFEEIYLSPELMAQFRELRGLSYQLRPPEEFKEQTKNIRSITFEFTKLRMEMTEASKWIFYYVNKYLAPYIEKFKKGMQGLNDAIVKNMPKWTKEIAQVVSWVGRLGVALFSVGEAIYKLFKELPDSIKTTGSAFLGFFTLLKMGPIGWLIAGITALLLLMDDFTTYKSGGESAFSGMWEELEKFQKKMEEGDLFGEITESVKDLSDSVLDLMDSFSDLFKNIDPKTMEAFSDGIVTGIKVMVDVITKLVDGLKTLVQLVDAVASVDTNKLKDATGITAWNDFQDAGGFSELYNQIFNKGSSGYVEPKAQNQSTSNNLSNVFNIYGSDPQLTANAVERNMDGLMMRNQQSWGG